MTECGSTIDYPDWHAACELGAGHAGPHAALGRRGKTQGWWVDRRGYCLWSVSWPQIEATAR